MTIGEDIKSNSRSTFGVEWTTRNGTAVPEPKDLKLSNDVVRFEKAAILYADLDGSTDLVGSKKWQFAGEVYKTFLYAASRLIRAHGGSIVSYDGDRVMGIFISGSQCNDAVSCALQLNWAVKNIVQAELNRGWTTDFKVRHVVGIDTSEIRAARTGVRGDNDIVWIGNAANLAAKLTALNADRPTYITKRVYDLLNDPQKLGPNKENMWQRSNWAQHNNQEIYSTTYWRSVT